jgi:diguanylate cyclase (GGDEF)-like protein/PAS domain S-box-containing protein
MEEAVVAQPGDQVADAHDRDEAMLFGMALGAAHAVAWVWDVAADDLAWYGDAKELYGFAGPETHGPSDSFLDLLHPDDRIRVVQAITDSLFHGADYEVEYRSVLPDGSTRWHRTKGTTVTDGAGKVTRMLGVATDITERRAAEEQLAHLALHDSLTGLANRVLLRDRLDEALLRQGRTRHHLAVLFVDLDGFKAVNDRAGHEAGDQVLVETASRLRTVLRASDTIARFGGDEFVVVAEAVFPGEAMALAERIVTALARPHLIGGLALSCPASVGLCLAEPGSTASMLLREADAAMYEAKGSPGHGGGWSLSSLSACVS